MDRLEPHRVTIPINGNKITTEGDSGILAIVMREATLLKKYGNLGRKYLVKLKREESIGKNMNTLEF